MSLFEKHKTFLEKAISALHERSFYAAYPEHPSKSIYGENADEDGQAFFKKSLGQKFQELNQDGAESWIGSEESPYLNENLPRSSEITSIEAKEVVKNRKFKRLIDEKHWSRTTLFDYYNDGLRLSRTLIPLLEAEIARLEGQ